ncbi:MAG: periplasmic heavy metal sensor [Armatimonadota bacterium]|nr:periplasmic heavy metal sensor [bacterium]
MKKLLLTLAVLAGLPVVVFGQAPPPARVFPAPPVVGVLQVINVNALPMLSGRLGLTSEQEPKVRDLLRQSDEALKPKIAAQRTAAEKFITLLTKQDSSSADIAAAADEASKADSAILSEKIKTFVALRDMLTETQRVELGKLMSDVSIPWRPKPTAPPISSPAAK